MEFGIYIPQVAISFSDLAARAGRCEAAGYSSFWLFDHLYAPGLPDRDALEGWTTATALLARTSRLRVGHLVLNNNFRHPALLARMATTLDHISEGRLELGIGSGSYAPEHAEGGFPWGSAAERTERLADALAVLDAMLDQDRVTHSGPWYSLAALPSRPRSRPRIHVGGAGRRTLPLVARHADVWNVPTYALESWTDASERLDACCDAVGRDPATLARSVEAVLALGPEGVVDRARSRYPGPGWGLDAGGLIGSASAVVDRIGTLAEQGISLFVLFPADRGDGEMLEEFATEVMPHFTHA